MNIVTASFDTTVRQMTEISQWPKCLSKKWPKYLSQRKKQPILSSYSQQLCHLEHSWFY